MATKKAKTTKKTTRKAHNEASPLVSAAGILFGGGAVVLLGIIQEQENLQLLLVGFGAALLVLGGTLVGMATRPVKKR